VQMSDWVWFNGRLTSPEHASPSVASNTLHLGIAVFDGIMAYWNGDRWNCHLIDDHLDRFLAGSGKMGLWLQWTSSELADGIRELLETLPHRTHYLRPIAYRTAAEVFFEVAEESTSTCIFAVPVERDIDTPYRCQLSPVQRVRHEAIPATWKVSGAYANSYLAERTAREEGYDTGVMLNTSGFVCEASSSNLFFIAADQLVTPRADGDLFPGLTRQLIMRLARARTIDVTELDLRPEELGNYQAAFLCGTLSEVRPVSSIGSFKYDSMANKMFAELLSDFRDCTHGPGLRYLPWQQA
jgi:branched-chain amino acid aminotransferase